MADALMKYETIDASQIDDIMAGKEPRQPQDWGDQDSTGSGQTVDSQEDKDKGSATDKPIGGPAGQH
jgi:cell division protease FtsH